MQTQAATKVAKYLTQLNTTSALRRAALLSLAATIFPSQQAFALPTGGQVQAGTINITQPDANNLVIHQTTDRGVIDWKNFDILKGETTRFNQNSVNSITLNRVTDGNPTQIYGNLTANGRIIVQNGSGVHFGAGSRVDVGGLIATTADISTPDFMAGSLNFNKAGKPNASITNQGRITAAQGGLVALVAPGVRNDGIISAKMGTVKLGSAQTVAIDMYGDNLYSFSLGQKTNAKPLDKDGKEMESLVDNKGTIEAQRVFLTANAAKDIVNNVVNNDGVIEASSATVEGGTIILGGGVDGNVRVSGTVKAVGANAGQKGGSITVTGKNIALVGATIDASGKSGGGKVLVGGDFQGDGTLAHAETVSGDAATTIDVSATDAGNGGLSVLWSDIDTSFSGTLRGTGGVNGGNGGQAEVSSEGNLFYNAVADLHAYNGKNGNLLLDPLNITIGSILAAALEVALTLGTDVTVSTPNITNGAGNITVADDVQWLGSGTLTLEAVNNIIVNDVLRALGTGGINLNAGNNIAVNSTVRTNSGNITTTGKDLTITNGAVRSATGNILLNNSAKFASNLFNAIYTGGAGRVTLRQSQAGSVQNAIDAIGPTGTGGATLTLGAGTWNEQITIDQSNFNLTGQGNSSVIKAPVTLNTQYTTSGPNKPVIYVHDADNVNLSSIKVDGNNAGNANYRIQGIAYRNAGGSVKNTTITNISEAPFNGNQHGVALAAQADNGIARALEVKGNTIANFQKNGMTLSGKDLTVDVQENTVTGNGATAITAQNGIQISGGANGLIKHNTISGIGYTPASYIAADILVYQAGNNVTLDNNIIDGAGYAAGIAIEGTNNVNVLNNEIQNAQYGAYVSGGTKATFTGNKIKNSGVGIGVYQTSAADVSSNILTNNTTGLEVYRAPTFTASNNTISGNGDQTGIRVEETTGAILTNNDIDLSTSGANPYGAIGAGISLVKADKTEIYGSATHGKIKGAGGMTGIKLDNSDQVFVNGVTIDGGKIGVGVYNGSDSAVVNNNTINNQYVAVDVNGANNFQAFSNTMDNFVAGINVVGATGNVALLSNTLSNYGQGEGIHVKDTVGAQVYNNIISSVNKGIVIEGGSGATILGGKITNSTTGIFLDRTATATAESVRIDGGKTGFYLNGSTGATLNRNILTNAQFNGILAENGSTGLTAFKNNIAGSGNGILLGGGSGNATLDTNTLTGGNGIESSYSNNVKALNNIISSSGRGIAFTQAKDFSATGNVITTPAYANANTDTGITVANATGVINVSSNTITQPSGKTGIHIKGTPGATLTGNTITGGNRGIWIDGSNNATITGGSITGAATGIRINPSSGSVTDGVTITGGTTGVELVGSTGAVVKNNILRNQTNAVLASAGSTGLDAFNNTITGAGNGFLIAGGSHGAKIHDNLNIAATNGVAISYSNAAEVTGNIIKATIAGIKAVGANEFTAILNTITGATTGISVTDATGDILLRNNSITGNGDQNGIAITRTANAKLRGNDIDLSIPGADFWAGTGTAIKLDTANGTKVTGNGTRGTIKNAYGTQGIIATNSDNVEVTGMQVTGGKIGIGFYNGSDNGNATGNTLKNLYVGVDAVGGKKVTINGNTIDNIQNGIIVNAVTGAISVAGNTLNHYSMQDGIQVLNSDGAVITGNDISGANHGIVLDGSDKAFIAGGILANNKHGITVDGSDKTVIGGVDINGGKVGITVNGGSEETSILGNLIRNQQTGVKVRNAEKVLVAGNRMRRNDTGVDAANSSEVFVIGNRFRNNETGIAFDTVTDSGIYSNSMKGLTTGQTAIDLFKGSDVEVAGNTIEGYAEAINADRVNSGLKILDNTITDGNTTVKRSDGVILKRNHITNGDILVGNSDDAVIRNNDITGGNGIGITLRNSENGTVTGNTVTGRTLGYLLKNVKGLLFNNNKAIRNGSGAEFAEVEGATVSNNRFRRNTFDGLTVADSSGIVLTGNRFVRNNRGVVLTGTDGTTLTGDIFTNNVLGLNINNSAGTVVNTATFTGGDIAIQLDGFGSEMQFGDNGSSFDGMNYYFELRNGAMFGSEINASQQTFAGVRAADFTYQQLLDAEAKTLDVEDPSFDVGNVFYSNVQAPIDVTFDGTFEEFQRKRSGLYRTGLFSYAGKTLANVDQPVKFTYDVNQVQLSLLNGGNTQNTTALLANRFANLAPAAGGKAPVNAADFASLAPAAGGTQVAANTAGGCGNSFLGDGYSASFTCSQ